MRILIVDDQRSIRLTLAQAARAEGHETDTADSGRVALLKMQEESYDLVLLDLRMEAESDGLDCLARLQKVSPGLPVVICTAHASIETAVEAMRRGAHDYLEKPFTPEQLRHLFVRVEKSRRLRQRVDELEEQVAQVQPALDFTSEEPEMAAVISVVERAAARSSWTKSGTCRPSSSPSSCASCRNVPMNAWAKPRPAWRMFACSPRPIAI